MATINGCVAIVARDLDIAPSTAVASGLVVLLFESGWTDQDILNASHGLRLTFPGKSNILNR